eukprot:m.173420 g.173420  ORF g.173420 m.173420 type:complete len:178 (+) comp53270_c0_seq1:1708-2241(+)
MGSLRRPAPCFHLRHCRHDLHVSDEFGRVPLERHPVSSLEFLPGSCLELLHGVGHFLWTVRVRAPLVHSSVYFSLFVMMISQSPSLPFRYGGPVTQFLSNSMWTPFSRLVYGAYLVHPILMYGVYYSGSRKLEFSFLAGSLHFLGYAVAAFFVSLVGHLLVEKPLNNVQKIVLPAGR